MNEWKELRKEDIPSDILVADYEFRIRDDLGYWNIVEYAPTQVLVDMISDYSYQYRKKELPEVMPFGKFWDFDEECDYGYLESFKTMNCGDRKYVYEMYLGGSYYHFEAGLPEEFKKKP